MSDLLYYASRNKQGYWKVLFSRGSKGQSPLGGVRGVPRFFLVFRAAAGGAGKKQFLGTPQTPAGDSVPALLTFRWPEDM